MAQLPPPPVYHDRFSVQSSVVTLPAYTRRPRPSTASRRELTEHIFELKSKKSKPWATLKLLSSARNPDQLPTYIEGDSIGGSLGLSLDHPDHILRITATIKGQIITGNTPEDQLTFLDSTMTIWSKDFGDPRQPTTTSSPPSHYSGKLHGEYNWPILFPLPREIVVSPSGHSTSGSGSSSQLFQLPQTFVERHTRASIHYNIVIDILRGRFRLDSKLRTMFVYIPAIKPAPSSPLRQLAYRENTPIPGPEVDPEGWMTLSRTTVQGKIFSTREVKVYITLSLAKPLCYTRGSVIPCSLSISCSDSQALDLLGNPLAICVYLRRQVKFHEVPSLAEHNNGEKWLVRGTRKDVTQETGPAAWWPSTRTEPGNSGVRQLSGEIRLPKSLKPSCAIAHFSIDYCVVVLPFEATAFTSLDTGPLLEQRVEIATIAPDGPRTGTYAPPEYGSAVQSPPPPRGAL